MNNQAIIAKVDEIIEIPGATNVVAAKVLGEICVVSKDTKIGDVGILMPDGLQLSEEYCRENNLFRDKSYNKDTEKSGFFDANRKVRAQTFLKTRSTAYFASIDSVAYAGKLDTTIGYTFDKIGDKEICRKYYSKETLERIAKGVKSKQPKKDFSPDFAKHVDTEQFLHNISNIKKGSLVHIHSKRHGSSFRVGRVKVAQELNKFQKFVNKVSKREIFPEYKMDYVVGTRNVILQSSDKEGFHGSEAFRFEVLESIKPHIVDNMLIFGEIVGFVNGKPIMAPVQRSKLKNKEFNSVYPENIVYSYGCKPHEYKFFVYRVAMVQADGSLIDFSQAQLESWCDARNIAKTLNLIGPFVFDGNHRDLQDLVVKLGEREDQKCADPTDPSHLHEGCVVRIESGTMIPKFYKYKTFWFKVGEGLAENVDTEDSV